MSMSLYQLAGHFLLALDHVEVDEETGEVTGFEYLEKLDADFEEKALNCAVYAKGLKAEIDALKAEEDALKARRQSHTKKLESFKRYVASCMDAAGKDKIANARAALSFRASQEVVVDDMEALPFDCVRVKIDRQPDKTAIKKAIKSGAELEGAHLVDKRNLQIK